MTTDHHIATSNFPFFKKRSSWIPSWIEIQFAKCEGFFCLDLWVATHAKTGRRNDFREYKSKVRCLDNTQNRKSQTVSLAEILFLYCNGMCWWPHTNRKTFIFTKWIIIIVIIMICASILFLVHRDRENSDTFLACLRSGVRSLMAEVEDSLSAISSYK